MCSDETIKRRGFAVNRKELEKFHWRTIESRLASAKQQADEGSFVMAGWWVGTALEYGERWLSSADKRAACADVCGLVLADVAHKESEKRFDSWAREKGFTRGGGHE